MSFTYYWHDYETFGTHPARDRPAQFAGLRTDSHFQPIGDPLVIYCCAPRDRLPAPEACLLTGITPQKADREGVTEAEFARCIHQQLSQPGTCGVGYNSMRFDDEVTRYLLYRNFYDPYGREWQHGNARWDIIDMVRACCALRPDGIQWPLHDDGTVDFRLASLTQANQLQHQQAHDALSDVKATITLAQLIQQQQPKLFAYCLALKNKNKVREQLDVITQKPVLHTSAMFPARDFCTRLVMPLAMHPINNNGVICYDLSVDPMPLLTLSVEQLRERLYTPSDQLPEGVARIALKTIHINRCPLVVTAKMLDKTLSERLHIDREQTEKHYQQLRDAPALIDKLQTLYAQPPPVSSTDPEEQLYSGGFFSDADKRLISTVQRSKISTLADKTFPFHDPRLSTLLFRYRCRNDPASLSAQEQAVWEQERLARLHDADNGLTPDQYRAFIHTQFAQPAISQSDQTLLQQLLDYADDVLAKHA